MASYPHVDWVDLYGDGTLHECAIVKQDQIGNLYFIRLKELDMTDRRRMHTILTGRNATNFALWDLLYQTTLGNGMNALDYFHQYVKVKTPRGQIMTPQVGAIGSAMRNVGVINVAQPQQVQQVAEQAPAPAQKAPARRTAPPA